ncbi:MAG: nitrate- and nitrite sensing domain-containing protein [Bdellovibrionales bacterium]|nr:nitrate- and nitrite sensing domain-containing protein [Bdellovibrionales bacterium]
MFRKLSLRFKMFLMFFPVLLGLVVVAGLILKDLHKRSATMAGVAIVADSINDLGNLVHNTQLERGLSNKYLGGNLSEGELKKQREIVDKLSAEAHKMYTQLPLSDSQRKGLESELNSILAIRGKVDAKAPSAEIVVEYSSYIRNLINAESQLIGLFPGTKFTDSLIALVVGELTKEAFGRSRAGYSGVFLKDLPVGSETLVMLEASRGGIAAHGTSPVLGALPKLRAKFAEIFSSDRWKSLDREMGLVAQLAAKGNYGVDGQKFFSEISLLIDDISPALQSEAKVLFNEAQQEEKKTKSAFVFFGILLALSVVGLSIYGFLSSRGIIRSLEGVASVLSEGARSVGKATKDIGSVSSDLSSSTHEQAAALHETMASIQYIGSMITRNSENAKLSEQVAAQGNDEAQKGQQAVNQMIGAIGEISRANTEIADQIDHSNQQLTEIVKLIQEIGNKTKIINDIVFQTKLLSFNASVEAARAGEYGKGFAVVAEEVGNLAQMSGAAAKEISQMLEGSISRVETIVTESKERVEHLVIEGKSKITAGTEVAKRCGDSLAGIVTNVGELKRLVSEISEASQEQTLGMGEITKAVAQLEVVTQNNTNAATNSESANKALNGQTDSLNDMVRELGAIINGGNSQSHDPDDFNEGDAAPTLEDGSEGGQDSDSSAPSRVQKSA